MILDLTWRGVAISSVHKYFEKHAFGFGLKERRNGFKKGMF